MQRYRTLFPDDTAGKKLRGRRFKNVLEASQAALFGYAYGCAHHLGTLQIRHNITKQYSDSDATFRWDVLGRQIVMEVQLKELPPRNVNETETIDSILEKLLVKYPKSSDLTVAIHSNRTESNSRDLVTRLSVGQLWMWAWSKPDSSEIYLAGGGAKRSTAFRVPFRPHADMGSAEVIVVATSP